MAGIFTHMSFPLSRLLKVLCPSPGPFLLREAWQGLSQSPSMQQVRRKESPLWSQRELWIRHNCLPGAPSPGPGHSSQDTLQLQRKEVRPLGVKKVTAQGDMSVFCRQLG